MADQARGERLRALRAAKGRTLETGKLSRETAAGEIGVTAKTLYTWEHGGPISWPNAVKAARYYGVEAESLVTREPYDGEVPELAGGDSLLERMDHKLDQVLGALGVERDDVSEQPAAAAADPAQGMRARIVRGEKPPAQAKPPRQKLPVRDRRRAAP